MSLVAALGAGLALGLRHATDADHVAAMVLLVRRGSRTRAAVRAALAWGLGHSASVLAVGIAIVALGWRVPPSIEIAAEVVVGGMLVLLGLVHLCHAPCRDHAEACPGAPDPASPRALAVGIAHGLAGSAGVALVAVTAIESRAWALGYLVAFAAGTMLGMATFTAVIAGPLAWGQSRERLGRAVVAVASVASVACGVAVLLELYGG